MESKLTIFGFTYTGILLYQSLGLSSEGSDMSLPTIGANNPELAGHPARDLDLISQGEIPMLQIQWRVNNCIMSLESH